MLFSLVLVLVAATFVSTSQAAVLVNFHVNQPPIAPRNARKCTLDLIRNTFGNSYYQYAIAPVIPPAECGPPGSWAAITLNLTVTSNGTQYDRLAIVSYGNVEVWRTSTPEPTRGDGIIWTYIKDVTKYTSIFQRPGPLQLQLDNVLSDELGLDGQYDARLSITYYQSSDTIPPAPKSDGLIRLTNFTAVPPIYTARITFPRNTVKAFAELYASGNSEEEFWYLNTASKFLPQLPPDTSYPNGPFREIRLRVDGQLAGIAFPYPVYFTGAITPNAWRPIPAYGSLDQPTYNIDLTPFIPILTDGATHNLTIDVLSAEDDHAVNSHWWISGLVQIVLDSSDQPTTGKMKVIDAPEFAQATGFATSNPSNGDTNITVLASRQVHIEADIVSGSGVATHVVWKQELTFSNTQRFFEDTTHLVVTQESSGHTISTHNEDIAVNDKFSYPMTIDYEVTRDSQNWTAKFDHSYVRSLLPSPFDVASDISNRQIAAGAVLRLPNGTRIGFGDSSNIFSYSDARGNTYSRKVDVSRNNITQDEEGGTMANLAQSEVNTRSSASISEGFVARLPRGSVVQT